MPFPRSMKSFENDIFKRMMQLVKSGHQIMALSKKYDNIHDVRPLVRLLTLEARWERELAMMKQHPFNVIFGPEAKPIV